MTGAVSPRLTVKVLDDQSALARAAADEFTSCATVRAVGIVFTSSRRHASNADNAPGGQRSVGTAAANQISIAGVGSVGDVIIDLVK